MGTALATVTPIDSATKSLRHNGLELIKPCTRCDRPAAFKLRLTTGIDDVWEPTEERACTNHLPLSTRELGTEAMLRNGRGDHPVLFPWAVEAGPYQR